MHCGNTYLLSNTCIGIVGTRKASELGNNIAKKFAMELNKRNITIVSGLASGIDTNAHMGAITNTIAIVAGGFEEILRGEKYVLAKKILENNGLIISEYPQKMPVLVHQFLDRNRLISALSKAVIVVEAPEKSGALNTAMHAIEQGKKLFVVPWNLDYWKGEGCNNLLIEGATPLINTSQIFSFLYASTKQLSLEDLNLDNIFLNEQTKNIPEEYKPYYEYIKENAPVSTQELISFFNNKTISEINSELSMMEIEGYIKLIDNKYYID